MRRSSICWFAAPALIVGMPAASFSADIDEFKVKRQEVFEFTEKPAITRNGDKVTIRFASKAFCDVTVAIEDAGGTIVRHLASGVLGPNAPVPFQMDSLKQMLVWDGKDDRGEYVRPGDGGGLAVRVSLGLRPKFERTMFWSPQKRVGVYYPVMRAAAEGVYVAEGDGVDHIRLFDHQGNYLRTICPFPADKINKVEGIELHAFVQDGQRLPLKHGYHQATLLTCGTNALLGPDAPEGFAAAPWPQTTASCSPRPQGLPLTERQHERASVPGWNAACWLHADRIGPRAVGHAGGRAGQGVREAVQGRGRRERWRPDRYCPGRVC